MQDNARPGNRDKEEEETEEDVQMCECGCLRHRFQKSRNRPAALLKVSVLGAEKLWSSMDTRRTRSKSDLNVLKLKHISVDVD